MDVDGSGNTCVQYGGNVVVNEHIIIAISQNSRVARCMNVDIASEKLGATTIHHGLASLIDVRISDLGEAANHSAICALNSLTAAIESGSEIKVVAMLSYEKRPDGTTIVRTSSDGYDVTFVDGLAGRRTQLNKLEVRPKGAQ
jgi:hypothetical protein